MNKNRILFNELLRMLAAKNSVTAVDPIRYNSPRYTNFKVMKESGVHEISMEMILEMRMQGASYYKIASRINKLGISTRNGAQWYGATIFTYVRNRYCELPSRIGLTMENKTSPVRKPK